VNPLWIFTFKTFLKALRKPNLEMVPKIQDAMGFEISKWKFIYK